MILKLEKKYLELDFNIFKVKHSLMFLSGTFAQGVGEEQKTKTIGAGNN